MARKTPAKKPTDAEVLRKIRRIISDWQLARGALGGRMIGMNAADIALIQFPECEFEYDPSVHDLRDLPDDERALKEIVAAMGMTVRERDVLTKRFDKWLAKRVTNKPAEPC